MQVTPRVYACPQPEEPNWKRWKVVQIQIVCSRACARYGVVVSDHALQPLLTVEAVPLARDHRDGGVAALWWWSAPVILPGLDSLPLFLPSLSPEQAIVYVDLVKWEEGRRGER